MPLCLVMILALMLGSVEAAPPNPRLIKRVNINWKDVSLLDGLVQLAKETGISLRIDEVALLQVGHPENAPITVNLSMVPMLSGARQVVGLSCFSQLHLETDGRELRLTSSEKARETYTEVVYSLQKLQAAIPSETELADALNIVHQDWSELGGQTKIVELTPISVRIYSHAIGHEAIAQFFSDAELALQGRSPVLFDAKATALLKKPYTFPAGESPLQSQIDGLLKGTNYLIDQDSLLADEISLDSVTAPPAGKGPVLSQLNALCKANKLDWIVRDGILIIMSQSYAENDALEVRVYDVRKHITPELTPFLMAAKLTNTPDVGPWADSGDGAAQCVDLGPLLVISNTRANHEKIAELLK